MDEPPELIAEKSHPDLQVDEGIRGYHAQLLKLFSVMRLM
jgi:hypothetical protein